MWTNNDIHIERIHPDQDFWLTTVAKVQRFFETSVLVELIGKFYSRTSQCSKRPCLESSGSGTSSIQEGVKNDLETDEEANTTSSEEYCYCRGPEEGDMVGCDNPDCKIKWFHSTCLNMSLPKCKYWYCPDCRKLPNFKRKSKKKT